MGEPARPTDAPAIVGWARTLVGRWRTDNLSLIAAGVAFYSLLSLMPALAAAAGIVGLVGGPDALNATYPGGTVAALPTELRDLITTQLDAARQASTVGLTITAIVGIALSLWSASSALRHLVVSVNLIHSGRERRSFVRLRILGLALTVAFVVYLVVAVAITALLPAIIERAAPGAATTAMALLRWPVLVLAMLLLASVVYRVAPEDGHGRPRLITAGTVTAAAVWLVASVGFSTFVGNTNHFASAYGSLVTAVVTLLWFWLFAVSLLLGAEVDVIRADSQRAVERLG